MFVQRSCYSYICALLFRNVKSAQPCITTQNECSWHVLCILILVFSRFHCSGDYGLFFHTVASILFWSFTDFPPFITHRSLFLYNDFSFQSSYSPYSHSYFNVSFFVLFSALELSSLFFFKKFVYICGYSLLLHPIIIIYTNCLVFFLQFAKTREFVS